MTEAPLTHDDVRVATIMDERAGVLTLARQRCLVVDRHQARGRFSEADGDAIRHAIRSFAGDIAIGLHTDGLDPKPVRDAMRILVVSEATDDSQ